MSRSLLLLLIYITWVNVSAQDRVQKPIFKGEKTIGEHLIDQLKSDPYIVDSTCARFITSVKFTLDKEGFVLSTLTSANLPMHFSAKIKKAIKSTENKWTPMRVNGLEKDSYPLMVILDLTLEGGCELRAEKILIRKNSYYSTFSTLFQYEVDGGIIDEPLNNTLMLGAVSWHEKHESKK